MSKDNDEEKGIKIWMFISIAIVLFILSLGAYISNFYEQSISKSSADWGTFGDFMGGTLNPMLAFLSFIALLYTIRIQSKELSLSRIQLTKTKKATKNSATALKKQSKSIKLQNFENTFFNMLELHNKIASRFDGKIEIRGEYNFKFIDSFPIKRLITANNSFSSIYSSLIKELNECNSFDYSYKYKNYLIFKDNNIKNIKTVHTANSLKSLNEEEKLEMRKNFLKGEFYNQLNSSYFIYNEWNESFDRHTGHYFRNIYQILKFIDNSSVKDKKFYSNILRAQLNQDELGLLFYNNVSIKGIKMLRFITKYEFLEHLNYNKRFCNKDLQLYKNEALKFDKNHPNKAFGNNNGFAIAIAKL